MHPVGPLHLWTPNCRSKPAQVFTGKTTTKTQEPVQFKPMCSRVNCNSYLKKEFSILFEMLEWD